MGRHKAYKPHLDPSMSTSKADFYIGRGKNMKWIGSCIDGFPPCENGRSEITAICSSKKEKDFIKRVNEMLENKVHEGAKPEDGWPWAYNDSIKTNYIYVFSYNNVKCSCYGSILFNPFKAIKYDKSRLLEWPDMEALRVNGL